MQFRDSFDLGGVELNFLVSAPGAINRFGFDLRDPTRARGCRSPAATARGEAAATPGDDQRTNLGEPIERPTSAGSAAGRPAQHRRPPRALD
jgi:hypothetical protein